MLRKGAMKSIQVKDASGLKIGVIVSNFNADVTDSMLEGALDTLQEWKVKKENIRVAQVPGAYELPYACEKLLAEEKFDALIALGCVIKGETKHDEYISHAVAQGIMRVMLDHKIPIAFGVLTPNTIEQAKARSSGKYNKGIEAARTALEMVLA